MKAWMSGNVAGTGTFRCTDCDYPISLEAVDELPTCPNCGGKEFVRASLFTTAQTSVAPRAMSAMPRPVAFDAPASRDGDGRSFHAACFAVACRSSDAR